VPAQLPSLSQLQEPSSSLFLTKTKVRIDLQASEETSLCTGITKKILTQPSDRVARWRNLLLATPRPELALFTKPPSSLSTSKVAPPDLVDNHNQLTSRRRQTPNQGGKDQQYSSSPPPLLSAANTPRLGANLCTQAPVRSATPSSDRDAQVFNISPHCWTLGLAYATETTQSHCIPTRLAVTRQ
jgi:hypothetical protein